MQDAASARNRALMIGAVIALVPTLLRFAAGGNQILATLVGCLACIAMLGSGTAAVGSYTNATRTTLSSGDGARMGFQVGLIVLVLSTALTLVLWLFAGMPSMADYMIEQMQRSGQDVPPEQLEAMAAMFTNPAFVGIAIVASIVISLGAPALGGLLGAAIFKKGGELPPQQTY